MGGIQKDVRDIQTYVKKQLLEFNTAHSDMSEKQWKELSQFANQIANKTKNMLANFEKEHKAMAADLRKNLADSKEERLKSEAERIKSFKVAMDGIKKDVKDIETYIRDYLREFNKSHSDMSAKQKRDLSVFMNHLVSNTGNLLKEFSEDNKKMAASWRAMTAILAKKRGLGSIVSAASEVMTVKEAIAPKPAAKKPVAKKPVAKKPAPKPAAKKAALKTIAEKPAPKPIARNRTPNRQPQNRLPNR
jgi:ribosomal protein S8